ncbi:MAG: DEAD/DEAH box helicase, partial [Actinomycetes bacterium]
MGDHGVFEVAPRLETLKAGQSLRGIVANESVTIVSLQQHGDGVATLTYRDRHGQVGERLLYRDDERSLAVDAQAPGFTFTGDGHLFRLVAEARRIRLAHLFDPMLAVHLSRIEPLPHQIEAVYGHLLPRQPLRFLLADDPGAGKTIMAGLYMKELMLRGDLRRCLIVAPGGLVAQWQDELAEKFQIKVEIVTRDMVEASRTGNPFADKDMLVARLDHLARNDDLQQRLAETDWDLVVVDEAHRMSAHFFGNEVKETKRYRLGRTLGQITRHLLLMTATPHAGKDEDFQLFMALLDPDRFAGKPRGAGKADTADLMRRMIKERLLRFDGRPLFPERRAYSVPYALTADEARLYEQVTDYVREEMGRAARLRDRGEGRRGNRVGFALTVLQRRLASSPE